MFAGHLGAALGLQRLEPRVGLGWLMLAALLLDVLLWLSILAGIERVEIPADYGARHYLTFVFPYSHGLLAALAWSVLAGAAAGMAWGSPDRPGWRAGTVVGLAVVSHFPLDALLHVRGLPLLDDSSLRLGFGLWNVMPLALGVELAVTAAGLLLYLSASPGRGRAIGMGLTVLVIAGLTVVGGTVAPVPGSINQIAVSGLLSIAVVVALAFALDRGAAILPPAR